MAAVGLKGFIVLGVVTIVFFFLLNTFILYTDQERYLDVESEEIRKVLEQSRENFNSETEAGTNYEDGSNKQEVNRQPRKENIQSLSSDESCEDKHVTTQMPVNEKLIGAAESFTKHDNYKEGFVLKASERVMTGLNQAQDRQKEVSTVETKKTVTTKTSQTKQRKRKETKEEKEKKEKDGYGKHAFNQSASDLIPLNRSIPDTRGPSCRQKHYPHDLPTASVIICFHNEALSTLLRTVHSVLNRSPSNLLAEVILVDDFSDNGDLMKILDEAVAQLKKVRLLRMPRHEGLVRARLQGAKSASGDVITFLDSHCEVNTDWLEPLLTRIQRNRTTVAIPSVDVIDYDTFKYKKPIYTTIGGFRWDDMAFYWHHVNLTQSPDEPRRSPVMPGGIFAIERKFFFEVGSYDDKMDVWGGENLEMSFRVWQCGGTMEIVPCSRVGHVYRRRFPYTSQGFRAVVIRNTARVVHVWMDEYKKYAYIRQPQLKYYPYGDISSRVELRKSLKCKGFGWYLQYVYPEQTLPARDFEVFGEVRNPLSGLCLETADQPTVGSLIGVGPCHGRVINQWFYLSKKGGLTLGEYSRVCVDTSGGRHVGLIACKRGTGYPGPWSLKGTTLYHSRENACLEVSPNDQRLGFSPCNNSTAQQWIIN